jgi:hypothetical protein
MVGLMNKTAVTNLMDIIDARYNFKKTGIIGQLSNVDSIDEIPTIDELNTWFEELIEFDKDQVKEYDFGRSLSNNTVWIYVIVEFSGNKDLFSYSLAKYLTGPDFIFPKSNRVSVHRHDDYNIMLIATIEKRSEAQEVVDLIDNELSKIKNAVNWFNSVIKDHNTELSKFIHKAIDTCKHQIELIESVHREINKGIMYVH